MSKLMQADPMQADFVKAGSVKECLWDRATGSEQAVFLFAHGAGAPMDSDFMGDVARRLASKGVTVVRFEFPYMQERRINGKKRPPERAPKLLAHWHKVIADIRSQIGDLPLYIGGKSMGGRMATLLFDPEQADFNPSLKDQVQGCVCFGYPFYATGKPEKPRIAHLEHFPLPVLVLQGERDAMGNKETVSSYRADGKLSGNIVVQWLPDGDHSLKPRKASGLTESRNRDQAVQLAAAFMNP